MDLRSKVIRLAHSNPKLRPHLLPLLKRAADDFEGKKFTNPETGNKVEFGSLPAEEQKKIRERSKDKGEGGSEKKPSGGASKAVESSKLPADMKKKISEKVSKNPDAFKNKSPGKSKYDGETGKGSFVPPGFLTDLQSASESADDDEFAEKAIREWIAKEMDVGPRDLEEQFEVELVSSRTGEIKVTYKG